MPRNLNEIVRLWIYGLAMNTKKHYLVFLIILLYTVQSTGHELERHKPWIFWTSEPSLHHSSYSIESLKPRNVNGDFTPAKHPEMHALSRCSRKNVLFALLELQLTMSFSNMWWYLTGWEVALFSDNVGIGTMGFPWVWRKTLDTSNPWLPPPSRSLEGGGAMNTCRRGLRAEKLSM